MIHAETEHKYIIIIIKKNSMDIGTNSVAYVHQSAVCYQENIQKYSYLQREGDVFVFDAAFFYF